MVPLTADQVVTLDASDLREYEMEDLLALMKQLGLSLEGVDSVNLAWTRLMQNAVEVS